MPEQLNRIEVKLAELEGKIDAGYASVEKLRKYALWSAIITVAIIVLPLLLLPLFLPAFFAAEGINSSSLNTGGL